MPAGGLAADRACGAGADATSAASTSPKTAPTSTSVPSGTAIDDSTPEDGAFTSTVTLSVSSSTRGSSAVTASPCCFIQRAIVAVVTLSPNAGTRISVATAVPLQVQALNQTAEGSSRYRAQLPLAAPARPYASWPVRSPGWLRLHVPHRQVA